MNNVFQVTPTTKGVQEFAKMNPLELFFSGVIVGPFIEEAAFRFLPLLVVSALTQKIYPIIITVLVSSFIFGFLHGDLLNVFVQGFSGLFLCFIYWKSGAAEDKHCKALSYSYLSHASWNFACCMQLWQIF
ncbi:MAG: CPBP family intramembrane metalloprotease [Candidatus Falkowbacteria bacterium]|nr:CPBP family intramembrane metalloprotease [Candidatus Falkowbacteria bacterium]